MIVSEARRFRLLPWGALVFAVVLLLALAQPRAALATGVSWGRGVKATLPANAATNPGVTMNSVSCPSVGDCTGVGTYIDSSNHTQVLLLTEKSGTWARGVEGTLPSGAAANPSVRVSSVSCASAGNCAAVGTYFDGSNHAQGVLFSESSGTWAHGVKASLPSGAATNPAVTMSSVSCASAGNCSAVGDYWDSSSQGEGLLLNESSGTWAKGVTASLPSGAATSPSVTLSSVSCASAGDCSAVGTYFDSSNHIQGVLLSESSGTWAEGVEASLPAAAPAIDNLASVSCPSAGNCTAVGTYCCGSHGILLDESSGTWAQGVDAIPPTGSFSAPDSVSCAMAGSCSAVGRYADLSNAEQGLLLSESSGTWAKGIEARLPAGAGAVPPYVSLNSISCSSAGDCGAVGTYIDNSNNTQGVLLSQSADTWASGVEASLPSGAATSPGVSLNSVSCPSNGECTVVGGYIDSSGHDQALLLTSVPVKTLTVKKSGSGRGKVTSTPAGISCGTRCSHKFPSGTVVTLTAKAASGSRFTGWSGACTGTGSCKVKMTHDRSVTAAFKT